LAALPRWVRNALAYISSGQHTVIAAAVRQAFDQPDRAHAGETWRKVAEQLCPRGPKLADLTDAREHEVLACMSFPRQHRSKLHSKNPIERPNTDVKRRADVVGIFPNYASIMRLSGAVLFEQNDDRQTSSRYMMVESFAQIDKGGDRPHSQHNHESCLIITSGHQANYTSFTDVTSRGERSIELQQRGIMASAEFSTLIKRTGGVVMSVF
jgi:hypothetical protein